MATTEQDANTNYADAQAQFTEHLMGQFEHWRQKLLPVAGVLETLDETDRLYAAQMAARFLSRLLRPAAVQDLGEIRTLVSPYAQRKFETDLTSEDFVRMIAETGAILKGHFVLLSGLHSDYFFMFSRVGMRIEFRKRLAAEIAKRFSSQKVDSVIAPVTAGGLLVQDVAAELHAKFAFFDVDNDSHPSAIRSGYSVEGATLIVNDMTTTGEGLDRMFKILSKDPRVKPIGVGLIAARGTLSAELGESLAKQGCKIEVLFHLAIGALEKALCENCRVEMPAVNSAEINR